MRPRKRNRNNKLVLGTGPLLLKGGVKVIDMHNHIIPGVDDGSKSLEMSREMVLKEIEYGVDKIILTPHMNKNDKDKSKILEQYNKLVEYVYDLDMEFYLGSEIYYYDDIISDLKNGALLTINNTKYILIEFSTRVETPIVDICSDLIVSGYRPIIAHIERYYYLTYEDYKILHKMGALIQINSKTFTSKDFKKTLKKMYKDDLIDLVASDAHNNTSRCVDFTYLLKKKNKYINIFNKMEEFYLEVK